MLPPRKVTVTMAQILIVDDNSALRSALERYLRTQSHLATSVPDARSALEMLEGMQPDVLVTDLRMPGMDGADLLRSLQSREIDVPVIMMSGADVRPEESAGAVLVLQKPFGPASLLEAIHSVLGLAPAKVDTAGA